MSRYYGETGADLNRTITPNDGSLQAERVVKKALVILAVVLLSITVMIVACAVTSILWLNMKRDEQHRKDAPLVDEAQATVEKYFREGTRGPSDHQGAVQKINNQSTFDRAGILEKFGELQSISGSGHSPPTAFTCTYHHLKARRMAHFSKGNVPLVMIVTMSRATAQTEVRVHPEFDYDATHGVTVFVSHPKLVLPD